MGKGRSRPQPTEQTVVQSNLPKYVQPYFERLLQRSEAESKRDYEGFPGQRLADTGQDVIQSRARVRDLASRGIQGQPTAQAATTAGIGRAAQTFDFRPQMFTDAGIAQQYMSPFMQNVVDVEKAQAVLDFDRARAARDQQAIQAGAFGGSRSAVAEALAGEELRDRLAQIQATGQQKAFEQAQTQFERDRAAREAGERLGISAAESATQQAAQLAALGDKARAGDVQAAQLLEQIGKDEQAARQAGLDLSYEDFVRQRDFPRESLTFLSSILRGVPVQPSTETQKFTQYNPVRDILGTGIAGLGLYKGLTGI